MPAEPEKLVGWTKMPLVLFVFMVEDYSAEAFFCKEKNGGFRHFFNDFRHIPQKLAQNSANYIMIFIISIHN